MRDFDVILCPVHPTPGQRFLINDLRAQLIDRGASKTNSYQFCQGRGEGYFIWKGNGKAGVAWVRNERTLGAPRFTTLACRCHSR